MRISKSCLALSAAILLAAPLLAAPASRGAQTQISGPAATEGFSGTSLTLTPNVAWESAVVRITGPRGYSQQRSFEGGELIAVELVLEEPSPQMQRRAKQSAASTSGLPDGRYYYEVRLSRPSARPAGHSGMFYVESGSVVPRSAKRSELAEIRQDLMSSSPRQGPGPGQGPEASGGVTEQTYSTSEYVRVTDNNEDSYTGLTLAAYDRYSVFPPDFHNAIGLSNEDYRLEFNLAVDTLYTGYGIDQRLMTLLTNYPYPPYLGINSTAPANSLHVYNPYGFNMRLDSGAGGVHVFDQYYGLLNLRSAYPFQFTVTDLAPSYTLLVASTGVGVGINYLLPDQPNAEMDIRDLDGNGFGAFRVTGSGASQQTWAVASTDTGVVTFNQIGSGGQEATFRQRMDASGFTFEVQGTAAATNHVNTSSRLLKTAFEAIDPSLILAKLDELPVTSWRFKEGPPDRHIGPVAEDFQAIFGLGDGKHISTTDAQGVLMAAVQALKREGDSLRQDLARKDAEIRALSERLEALEGKLEP